MDSILKKVKVIFDDKLSTVLAQMEAQKAEREAERAFEKEQARKRQEEQEKRHFMEIKRYFAACFTDFYITSLGDTDGIFPHAHYKTHNFIAADRLDVRTKVRRLEKFQREKIAGKLLCDFRAIKDTFWQSFAESTNAMAEEINRITSEMEYIFAENEEDRQRGKLSYAKQTQNENDFCKLNAQKLRLEKELQWRWEIWNAGLSVTHLVFFDGFLEFEIRARR